MLGKTEAGEWYRRKVRGGEGYQDTYKFRRPFKEHNAMRDSRATLSRGVLEVWFVMRPEGIANMEAMADKVRKELRDIFNVKGKDICEVYSVLGYTRVAYYCRMESKPSKETMELVEKTLDSSFVEAEVSRWDARTGEYQGTFRLSEFDGYMRFAILKHIEGDKKFSVTGGSKWKFAD